MGKIRILSQGKISDILIRCAKKSFLQYQRASDIRSWLVLLRIWHCIVCSNNDSRIPGHIEQASRKENVPENYFSFFSTKTYMVDTQKNRIDETIF